MWTGGGVQIEEKVRTLCLLPEGAVALDVIEVCSFLTADGARRYVTRFSGNAPVSTLLGLLRLGEHQILVDHEGWVADDGEEG